VKFLPQLLGRAFYRRKKFPLQVNLQSENLKKEIEKVLHQTILPLNHRGTSSMVTVGNMAMKEDQVSYYFF
jgi:ribosome biogenesis protein UTP30